MQNLGVPLHGALQVDTSFVSTQMRLCIVLAVEPFSVQIGGCDLQVVTADIGFD